VMVAGPWLFAAAATAYGYLPVLLAGRTGSWGLAYATVLTVVTLGTAALVQPWAKRIDTASSARGLLVALGFIAAGLLGAAAAASEQSVVLGLAIAVVLGVGLGIGLVSGLLEVQRMAGPGQLAGLTGAFYATAYTGFLLPTAMAALTPPFSTTALFAAVTVGAAGCALAVAASTRSHLPVAGAEGGPPVADPAGDPVVEPAGGPVVGHGSVPAGAANRDPAAAAE
jgi:hypothetical protein